MYRILIIDDEQVVREGISRNIDWSALGFELVGACRDGREGLEQVERLQPDVVLTDICMPFVDGLELAGAISDQLPNTKTILLTGYDEFDYAKEAVKLKVHDFLLKPITAEELTEMLRELRTQIDAERDRRQKLERLQEQLHAALPVYRERFLNRLVEAAGTVPVVDLEGTLALLELELPGPQYVIMVCDLDPPQATGRDNRSDEHLSGIAVQNVLAGVADDNPNVVAFSTAAEQAVAIVSVDGPELATTRALEVAELVSERAQREVGRTISVGVGGAAPGLRELPRSYGEAKTALEHRFVLGANQIITIHQVRGDGEPPSAPVTSESKDRYIQALKAGISEEAVSALQEVVSSLRNLGADMDYCHVVMHRLLADTIACFDAIGVDFRDVTSIGGNPFMKLAGFKTLSEIGRWFVTVLEEVRRLVEGRQQSHSRIKAVAAEEYIREHYMDPELSLQKVCHALAVSKSYLSSVFKSYSGMTLVEYLTEVRMEQARILLGAGDKKIYEVAEAVGFRDAHYFSLTFKKQTGQSPTEYRELAWRPAQQ